MPSPFPGMDPFLENPKGWQSFHTQFVVGLAQSLANRLAPRYSVSVETRLYVEAWTGEDEVGFRHFGRADVGVTRSEPAPTKVAVAQGPLVLTVLIPETELVEQHFLEIRDGETGQSVVTVVEVLSPSNKIPGTGRTSYQQKRETVLHSDASFVEIDLLRTGFRIPTQPEVVGVDYLVFVSSPENRPKATIIASKVRDRLPVFDLPLAAGEPGTSVDLNAVLSSTYDQGAFANRIDYSRNPDPALRDDDAAWADALLREKGLR